jgi:hypothetical protein
LRTSGRCRLSGRQAGTSAGGGREYNTTVLRWARWARAEVEAWPEDLSELDVTAGFSRIVSAASRPWPGQETG